MENIKELQDKVTGLDMQLLNHSNADKRHEWAVTADSILGDERVLWREVEDEEDLNKAIASAEQLLSRAA